MPQARLLIVDDEPGLRDMLCILMQREGFDVRAFAGFQAAAEALRTAPTPYDVVLTDLMMPDGSGLDLLPLAKERRSQTEVILMTAHSTIEAAIEAMRRGAYDFVTKPFGTAELRVLVQKPSRSRYFPPKTKSFARESTGATRATCWVTPRRCSASSTCFIASPRAVRPSS